MSEPAAKADEGKKGGGKKKLILIVLAVLLLGGGGAWFSGLLPKLLGKSSAATADAHGAEPEKPAAHGAKPEQAAAKPEHGAKPEAGGHGAKPETAGASSPFMDLPDIVANLNAGPRRTTFVKLRAKLELAKPEDQAALQAAMPRVLDLFQGYLRYRLREELLARTNLAAAPARVVSVLFTEMLIQ